ncbi:hypothetical protein ACLS0R_03835 [Comamonas jiangduensis]|uniref:hypothetical protein n=1 Tax=Comamonas jiangduensis TaxID=1194168 RepID=UPI003BF845CE
MEVENLNRLFKSARLVKANGYPVLSHSLGCHLVGAGKLQKHLRVNVSDDPHGWIFLEEKDVRRSTFAGDVMVIQDDSGKPITFEIRKWRQSGDFKPLGTN